MLGGAAGLGGALDTAHCGWVTEGRSLPPPDPSALTSVVRTVTAPRSECFQRHSKCQLLCW